MSGIIKPEGSSPSHFIPKKAEKSIKRAQEPLPIAEQAIASIRQPARKTVQRPPAPLPSQTSMQMVTEKDKVIEEIFRSVQFIYRQTNIRERLSKTISENVHAFDKKRHSFQVLNHVVTLSRKSASDPITFGIAAVVEGSSFGKGGFGSVYEVSFKDPRDDLVLKLSRKKIKSEERRKQKIPLTREERLTAAIRPPTPRGQKAIEEIEREIRIMDYIRSQTTDLTGLNVNYLGRVTFNNQEGYLIKKFTSDAVKYQMSNPTAEACFEFMEQVTHGLNTLHQLNLVHRDLKLENILVKKNGRALQLEGGGKCPSYDCEISDFGNTCQVGKVFAATTYPEDLIGHATPRNVSVRYYEEIKLALKKMAALSANSPEYKAKVDFIHQVLKDNDQFALGICLYMLWTKKDPEFKSFKQYYYFMFDEGLTEEQKKAQVDSMRTEIFAASHLVSLDKQGDENWVADQVMRMIASGLELGIR